MIRHSIFPKRTILNTSLILILKRGCCRLQSENIALIVTFYCLRDFLIILRGPLIEKRYNIFDTYSIK